MATCSGKPKAGTCVLNAALRNEANVTWPATQRTRLDIKSYRTKVQYTALTGPSTVEKIERGRFLHSMRIEEN